MYNNLQNISLYQNALLTALNVSAKVQATLPKELMDAAYIIYELQKVYAATPEGQQKNQLALAISEASRILLSEINNMPLKQVQNIIAPPPPPPPLTPRVLQVGDMFRKTTDTAEIPLYVTRINSINGDDVEIKYYKTDIVEYPPKIVNTTIFGKDEVLDKLNDNYWSDYDPIKVGDVYKQVVDTNVPPKVLWTITKVDKINNNLEFDITFSDPNISKADGSLNIIQYLQTIREGIYEKYVSTQNVVAPPPPPPQPPTPPTPPPPPPPPTSRTYKVGDKFKEYDDRAVPPIYIYTITEINDVDDTITFTLYRRNINTTETATEDSSDWELYLSNGELVPYVEPTTVAPPPPPPPPPPPKPKTPKPPKPPISNPPVVNFSCKEIKDAIKGLTLLVSLGDDTVLDEINELKQLLKTQNCK